MKLGFSKSDVTPRVGVELCGFGPYRCRHSIGIRDRLWARAMAVEQDGARVLIISCDLVGLDGALTVKVRERIGAETGVAPGDIMICCSHTHSGPSTGRYIGWGEPDQPYLETLPARIAKAGINAVASLQEGSLLHADVPCEGIGLNREYDRDAPPLEDVLAEDWRPEKPELTDTVCHVLAARDKHGALMGFASYFGCHPVVCCSTTRYIHGDFVGVATNTVEREHDGAVGLFLQGAQGDVNSCVVHKPEQEALLALDVVAARFAGAVRRGLTEAVPLDVDIVRSAQSHVAFTRKPWDEQKLKELLATAEERIHHPDATDSFQGDGWNVCMETVYAVALRSLLERVAQGESLTPETELHGIRLGSLAILGSPFETFQAIKNDVCAGTKASQAFVTSFVNDSLGYATDRTAAARGGYAADMVPLICGALPFADVHDELAAALLSVDAELFA